MQLDGGFVEGQIFVIPAKQSNVGYSLQLKAPGEENIV
jgi:hypothetical protein